MRCLISLGLILPALAGVIGVVAWAVSAETVMASREILSEQPPVGIQDRSLYDDRYDFNDFGKLPPAKAIPPPEEDDEVPDRSQDPGLNSLPILPAHTQPNPGDKPVYVVHFVVGDEDKSDNGFDKTTTPTTTSTAKATAATSQTTSRTTSQSTKSSTSSTTTTSTTTTTPRPSVSTSTLDPRSPEFASMLNRILSASKDGQGRAPQFVVFAPLPEDKKQPPGGFQEGTRYEADLPPKQSFLERPSVRPPGVAAPRLRDDYHREPLLTQHSYLPPQQVLTRRNGSNPNPFLPPPPPFQPGVNTVRSEPPEPPRPGIHSVGGFGASGLHDEPAAPYDPPGAPYEPPRRPRYPPPPHYDPVDSQRGLLHPASESAPYPHKDRSGFEIHAGDSHGGGHGKGITFTIGGGGGDGGHGGHGYGVSPMGVIKNLFLPFLPKPKVNLNGRVVFGVVLERGVGLGHHQHGHHHHQHAVAYHH